MFASSVPLLLAAIVALSAAATVDRLDEVREMTVEEVRIRLGALEAPPGADTLPVHSNADVAAEPPATFDARLAWPACADVIGNIRDQSACGSCWAEGAVESMSDRICIHSHGSVKVALSTDELMDCCFTCGMGCKGGYPFMAWQFWKSDGIVTGGNFTNKQGCQPYPFPPCTHRPHGSHWPPCPPGGFKTPHCSHECQQSYHKQFAHDKHFGKSAYHVKPLDVTAMQKEIMTYGPIEATFQVFSDFIHYKSGVYKHTSGPLLGGHAVKVIGWGEESGTPYWLIANSWDTFWGMDGYFKILRGANECGIEAGVTAGMPKLS